MLTGGIRQAQTVSRTCFTGKITHVGVAPVLWTSRKFLSAKLHHELLVALGQLSVQCSPVALTQHLQRGGRICLRVLVIAQHGGQGAVAEGPFGPGRSLLLCFPTPTPLCWPAGLAIGYAGGAEPVPLRNCIQRRLRKPGFVTVKRSAETGARGRMSIACSLSLLSSGAY